MLGRHRMGILHFQHARTATTPIPHEPSQLRDYNLRGPCTWQAPARCLFWNARTAKFYLQPWPSSLSSPQTTCSPRPGSPQHRRQKARNPETQTPKTPPCVWTRHADSTVSERAEADAPPDACPGVTKVPALKVSHSCPPCPPLGQSSLPSTDSTLPAASASVSQACLEPAYSFSLTVAEDTCASSSVGTLGL